MGRMCYTIELIFIDLSHLASLNILRNGTITFENSRRYTSFISRENLTIDFLKIDALKDTTGVGLMCSIPLTPALFHCWKEGFRCICEYCNEKSCWFSLHYNAV